MRRILSILMFVMIFADPFFNFANVRSAYATMLATTRYVATSGNDIGDCSSAVSPCLTIQYAVGKSSSGDTILVAQGIYMYNQAADTCTFLTQNGKSVVCIVDKILNIFGGYSTSNWSVKNPSANLTVIDGQNTYRGVFLIGYNKTDISLDIEGFTIQNGRTQGPNTPGDPSGFGGGMVVSGARTTLRDMIFRNNKVYGADTNSGAGGAGAGSGLAINWSQPGTSSLLERVTFEGNQSFGGIGPVRGGLVFGALFVNGSVTIDYGTFTNNQALAASSSGSGTTGGQNSDALGGAIGGGGGSWVLKHITATGNQVVGGNGLSYAGGGFGGGIYVEMAASFAISDSYLSNNLAQGGDSTNGGFGAGGGLLVNTTSATIDRVWLISNSAEGGNTTSTGNAGAGGGGGLYLWATDGTVISPASVTNVVIADNYVAMGSIGGTSPGGGGGGIQIQGQQAIITHSTIARNRLGPTLVAGQGLLVLTAPGVSSASANVNYSIIADHTEGGSGAAAVLVQQGNVVTFNRGLFAGNTKNTNSNGKPMSAGTINGLATMLSASSAGFVAPGSPNFDYHLLATSAAKDQAIGSTTPVDIDGQARPYGPVSDIGADEYELPNLSATPNSISMVTDKNDQVSRSSLIEVTSGPSVSWTAITTVTWLYLGPSGTLSQSNGQTGDNLIVRFAPGNVGLGSYDATIQIRSPSAVSTTIAVHLLKVDFLSAIYFPLVRKP